MTEIGAFEAKTQFSRLLARARAGEAITITHRGAAIAQLSPIPDAARSVALAALARLRARASTHRHGPASDADILDWVRAGRR